MRRSIFTFYRDDKSVAELFLELRGAGSVESWSWHGDPAMKKVIAPLPDDDQSLHTEWHMDILAAAERAGVKFTRRYEGEPLIPQTPL